MPRINGATGEVGHGVGGGQASINNAAFSVGGFAGFKDRDTAAFVDGTIDWIVSEYNLRTGARKTCYDTPQTANDAFAGGGHVASATPADGVRVTYTPFHLPGAGLLGMGPDGEIAYKPVSQSNGPTMVRYPDGTEWQMSVGSPTWVCLLGQGRAIWGEGGQIFVRGVPKPVVVEGGNSDIQMFQVKGIWWAGYFSYSCGVIAHPHDSFVGVVAAPSQNAWPEFSMLETGLLRVAISRGLGEQPGEIWGRDYDFNANEVRELFTNVTLGPIELADVRGEVPVFPPAEGDDVKALPRKMWISPYYSHSLQYGDTTDHVGNAVMVLAKEGDPARLQQELTRLVSLGQPLIVDAQHTQMQNMNHEDLTVAWMVSGANASDLEGRVNTVKANLSAKPTIAYLDKGRAEDWPEAKPSWMHERVWPAVQVYRNGGEALNVFKARIENMLNRVQGYGNYIALTLGFYDRSGQLSVAQIQECFPLYDQWIRAYPVIALLPFADQRPTGMVTHPELREEVRGYLNATVARPNRYDGWNSADLDTQIKNKMGQSVELTMLSQLEKDRILAALKGKPIDPIDPIDPVDPDEWPDLLPTLQAVRAKYGELLSAEEDVQLNNEVAWIHKADGAGLLFKDGGNHAAQPKSGIPCSVDWIVFKNRKLGKDALYATGNSEDGSKGPSTPQWGEGEPFTDTSRWVAPTQP